MIKDKCGSRISFETVDPSGKPSTFTERNCRPSLAQAARCSLKVFQSSLYDSASKDQILSSTCFPRNEDKVRIWPLRSGNVKSGDSIGASSHVSIEEAGFSIL